MSDNYFVRSGAKELLADAITQLLQVRPNAPLHFLAQHFSQQEDVVQTCVCLLQNDSSHPLPQETCYRAYQTLVSPKDAKHPLTIQQSATRPGSRRGIRSSNDAKLPKLAASKDSTIPSPSRVSAKETKLLPYKTFKEVLCLLLADLPSQFQTQVFTVATTNMTANAKVVEKQEQEHVPFSEFQKGVQICCCFTELYDALEDISLDIASEKERIGAMILRLETAVSELDNLLMTATKANADLSICFQNESTAKGPMDSNLLLQAILNEYK